MPMRLLLVGLLFGFGCSGQENSESAGESSANSSTAKDAQEKSRPKTGDGGSSSVADAGVLLERAAALLKQRNIPRAIEALSQAIAADPDNPRSYTQRALVYAGIKQDANALADFNAANRLDPKNAKLLNSRGFFLMSRKLYDRAAADFKQSIHLAPDNPQPHNNLGLIALAKREFDHAIDAFEAALRIDPDNVNALNNLGFAYIEKGDNANALESFNEAMRLGPDEITPYNNRGLLFIRMERYADAVADFTQAISRDGKNPKHYLYRRQAYLKLQKFDEAQADLTRVARLRELAQLTLRIARAPRDPRGYVARGEHFAENGEQEFAMADYNQALAIDPQLARAYSKRAAIWVAYEEYDKAIEDCTTAEGMAPHHDAFSIRGDAYLKKGDFDRAISDYVTAKRFDANVAQAYLLRAKAHEAEGNDEQAAADRKRAIALDPRLKDQ